jgi:hypothetical protein
VVLVPGSVLFRLATVLGGGVGGVGFRV